MSDDLINKKEALTLLQKRSQQLVGIYGDLGGALSGAARLIDELPTADRPQGEWIDEADKYDASFGIHDYRCSNCNSYADEYIGGHEWYTAGKPNFCPHCGAQMKGASNE